MTTECGNLQSQIRINIKHTRIIMPHRTKIIMRHYVSHFNRFDPFTYFIPAFLVIMKHTSYLVKFYAGSFEHIRYFRHGAGRTISQPFPGHLSAIIHCIESLIIDGCFGRKI